MTHAPLQRLSAALEEERRAIVEHDVEGLVRCTQEKLDALRALEAAAARGLGAGGDGFLLFTQGALDRGFHRRGFRRGGGVVVVLAHDRRLAHLRR